MRECFGLEGCRYVFDAACPLMRGPCAPDMPAWSEPLGILVAAFPWFLLWLSRR